MSQSILAPVSSILFTTRSEQLPTCNISELVIDICYWFKNFPACIEDYDALYSAISDDAISSGFLCFVDNRRLSLRPVIDRVLEHFAILRGFILKYKFETATKENACFMRICSHMKANEVTLAHLHTVWAVCIDLECFLMNLFGNLLRSFICCMTS